MYFSGGMAYAARVPWTEEKRGREGTAGKQRDGGRGDMAHPRDAPGRGLYSTGFRGISQWLATRISETCDLDLRSLWNVRQRLAAHIPVVYHALRRSLYIVPPAVHDECMAQIEQSLYPRLPPLFSDGAHREAVVAVIPVLVMVPAEKEQAVGALCVVLVWR